jgi:hypothetical protein
MSVRVGDRKEGKITAINADKGDTYYQVKRMQRHYAKLERMLQNGNNSGTVIKNGT